jgi:hypothetical protein
MKQTFLALAIAGTMLMLSGCSKSDTIVNTEPVLLSSGVIAPNITIGSVIQAEHFTDQNDKKHQISDATKKMIFAFKKDMGHIVKELLASKPDDYLSARATYFVADVSKMPSLIFKFAALPDLQESPYPILLITDESEAAGFMNEKESNRIMVVTLEKRVVAKVAFVATAEDLIKEIE